MMMEKELIKYLNELKSCIVVKSTAGGGAGSIIKMEFNNKTSHSNEEPLFTLWIECTWRIENKNKVIATSADGIEAITGLIAKSVRMLENKMIRSIKLTPFYDLCINFTDGFCLNVFCIFSYDYEFETNWRLSIPEQNLCYEINNYFKIKKGKYSD